MVTKKSASKKVISKTPVRHQSNETRTSRHKVSQADVPNVTLRQALRIPQAIAAEYGYRPSTPAMVASALDTQHTGGQFRRLSGGAIAYGLATGGAQSGEISITQLGLRIVRPTVEGDDELAMREAFLQPRVIRQFLEHYNGANIPREQIARNMLLGMGVPQDRTESVFRMILEGGRELGFITEREGRLYVDLQGATPSNVEDTHEDEGEGSISQNEEDIADTKPQPSTIKPHEVTSPPVEKSVTLPQPVSGDIPKALRRRVFITHGKNKAFIETIRKLLGYAELEAVVAAERQTVSQPVPDKVMNDMRSCGGAIIHVDAEQVIADKDGKDHVLINPNVLMEIGAAMALYGRRFILLVKEGVTLPTSNTQGLFEVRYTSDTLDANAAMGLLDAINDMKNHPLPERYNEEFGQQAGGDVAKK
jgi:hypothetical protein